MALNGGPQIALIAFNRFGLGARAGDLAAAASDPRGFVAEELKKSETALIAATALSSSKVALQNVFEQEEQRKQERARVAALSTPNANAAQNDASRPKSPQEMSTPSMAAPSGGEMGMSPPSNAATANAAPNGVVSPAPMANDKPKPDAARDLYRGEVMARLQKQMQAGAGFVERLVAFWSNHFAVSVAKGQHARASAGAFEREAIRPYVLGRFADMVKAVEQHPTMLYYLDNQRSMGPNSKGAANRKGGLNENLAREIMELHTLGVDGGYSQADVTALARVITGWSFAGRDGRLGEPGTFIFVPNWHEPGEQKLLSVRYPQPDVAQGEAALADLARHPATARHIAAKFVRHFMADDPPPPLVGRIEKTFHDTDGDLGAVSLALLNDDDAWNAPMTKMRNPWEFVVAMGRATAFLPPEPQPIIGELTAMGMAPWSPPGPNGFPDIVAAWASPEAMKVRLDVAWRTAQRIKDIGQPVAMLDATLGAAASQETREAVSRAESRQQALAILFMSPEFQRR